MSDQRFGKFPTIGILTERPDIVDYILVMLQNIIIIPNLIVDRTMGIKYGEFSICSRISF